ncbi:MAG: amidohydrolase family protein [Pseudomonadota bacterium]
MECTITTLTLADMARSNASWLACFEHHLATLGLERAVIVHSILYGGDNTITTETVRRMGGRARGICLVTDDATDAELDDLAAKGTAGIRLNYVHGGLLSWEGAKALAPRLAERGMHIQMLLHTHRHMLEIAEDIRALPVSVCLDHIGWPDLSLGLNEAGFQALLRLVGEGDVHVKLSGIYRVADAPYDAANAAVARLAEANPERCVWGSDWPHLMLADAKQPDAGELLNAFLEAVPSEAARQAILVDTPTRLYGF